MRRLICAVATAALLSVAGCGHGSDWSQPRPHPTPVGSLGAGFTDPASPPTPEGTVTPAPGSWDDVHPARGYRVVLLHSGDDAPTKALMKGVRDWAEDEDVDLREVPADTGNPIPGIVRAMDLKPELIVSAGNPLIDALTTVSASHLDQRFLVVGAELAEPTHNVTAVDWKGASFRGEGLGMSSAYDANSFTEARCADAIRAGAAAVLTDLTGIVVWLS
ncbi:hypothetical protein AB0J83_15020 [Actinoplanes sp. NPDC049596]|uniref:hypothetical protein n=1 Tax=unclassified Actinoplanes TaxID=2626549 RepID=UPI00342630FD